MVPSVTDMTVAERVSVLLACLAVDRRLGGLLFVDLPPTLLAPFGHRLNTMLTDGTRDPEIVTLGAADTDDELWWLTRLVGPGGKRRFATTHGPLIDTRDSPPRTVIVPDLARATLPVVRAAVTLVGADVAVADRNSRHAVWQPRTRWLAACARSDLGGLSPHLLDRFAVRLDASGLQRRGRDRPAMRTALDAVHDDDESALLDLPALAPSGQWTRPAALPAMTDEAIELVVTLSPAASAPARRDFALARVARAIAALDRAAVVEAAHVRRASAVLGWTEPSASQSAPLPSAETGDAPSAGESDPPAPEPSAGEEDSPADQRMVTQQLKSQTTTVDDLTIPADLLQETTIYPEDDPDAIPEYSSLRRPWQDTSRRRALRGQVIGIEPARSMADVAVVPTAFEAAKFQPIRRLADPTRPDGLVIIGSDLRRYRRQPAPDTAVVLVLDHTCGRDWDLAIALAPYLRWAYVRHAALSVVELGYQGGEDLRAIVYRTRSVLDSRIPVSLNRARGRATPLAHGLDLAVREVHRYLRRADVVAENSWLVVASDGRGNVPVEASRRGLLTGTVSSEGVTDALVVARALRPLSQLHKVVLAPPNLTHCKELPFELADAMGGIVADDVQ